MNDRRLVIAVFIVGLLLGAIVGIVYSMYSGRYLQPSPPGYEIHFSPKGGCADTIVYWIGRANQSVHVLMYVFTLQNVAEALISAHDRGIEVKIVFDKSQGSSYSQYVILKAAGIEVRNDTNPDGIMHNKVAIIDNRIVITGSFNWTNSAENSNNENLIVIRSVDVASRYESEFQKIWSQAQG